MASLVLGLEYFHCFFWRDLSVLGVLVCDEGSERIADKHADVQRKAGFLLH